MTFLYVRHDDPDAFLERAGAWLLEREAEHGLLLGIVGDLRSGKHDYDEPVTLLTVQEGEAVVGCAWRTPPYGAGVTRLPAAAVPGLVAELASVYDELPGILGDEAVAGVAARAWASLRGVEVRPGMRQRIHRLDALRPPERPASGRMRGAEPEDLDRIVRWWRAFRAEAGIEVAVDPRDLVERRIGAGDLWLWEDGHPVSLAGVAARTPNGARVGPVYTPPEERRQGYGTTLTAAVTRHLLDGGCSFSFLYTDLANPTSNAIYASLGYRPVCDVRHFHLGPGDTEDDGGS